MRFRNENNDAITNNIEYGFGLLWKLVKATVSIPEPVDR